MDLKVPHAAHLFPPNALTIAPTAGRELRIKTRRESLLLLAGCLLFNWTLFLIYDSAESHYGVHHHHSTTIGRLIPVQTARVYTFVPSRCCFVHYFSGWY
jgi:hypothetical protein